jgi:photosystem II stability/assembly factor-like uncharacterized protein
MDLAHPDVLYALVQELAQEWPFLGPLVLYRTQDAGSSWTPVASPAGIPQSVAVDPVTSRVYLLSGGSVFRSADGGATWTKVRDGLYGTLASIRKNEVFVWGGSPLAVIQSKDGGETWAELSPPLPSWGAVAGSPQEPSIVYLGLQVAGVGKSTDGGATWSVASDGISALTPSLAMDPAHPDDVYAGGAAGLFHSADGRLVVARRLRLLADRSRSNPGRSPSSRNSAEATTEAPRGSRSFIRTTRAFRSSRPRSPRCCSWVGTSVAMPSARTTARCSEAATAVRPGT